MIDGGPGDDHLIGGGGPDTLDGGQGSDGCEGAKGRTVSCGREKAPKASAYVELDPTPGGGAGLQIVGGGGRDDFSVAFDEAAEDLRGDRGQAAGDRPRLHPPAASSPTRSPAPPAARAAG